MYIYIHVYIHIHTYMCTYIYIHTCVHIHTYMCTYTYGYIHVVIRKEARKLPSSSSTKSGSTRCVGLRSLVWLTRRRIRSTLSSSCWPDEIRSSRSPKCKLPFVYPTPLSLLVEGVGFTGDVTPEYTDGRVSLPRRMWPNISRCESYWSLVGDPSVVSTPLLDMINLN